ncbi:TPA: hypothetical protein ACH3X2_000106 [Trebouxia sp. C0005]
MRNHQGYQQINALVRKNAVHQRRRLGTNTCLLITPFLFCILLWAFQKIINHQLDGPSFKCGCKCTSCCDWISNPGSDPARYSYQCFNATDDNPCSPYSDCKAHDDTQCGFAYSTADQVAYCSVMEPPIWPALLQLPEDQYAGDAPQALNASENALNISSAPLLYTGNDRATADALMSALFAREQPVGSTAVAMYQSNGANSSQSISFASTSSEASANDDDFAASSAISQGLAELQLIMGTAAPSSLSLYLEPAFFPRAGELASSSSSSFLGTDEAQTSSSSNSAMGQAVATFPLSFLMPSCSALQGLDQQLLSGLAGAITNATQVPTQCMSLAASWVDSPADMDSQLYCAWRKAGCDVATPGHNPPGSIRQYPGAIYDWQATNSSSLQVNMRVNDTDAAESDGGPPGVQRWNQAMNLAANAFLTYSQGSGFRVDLTGIRDMPKGESTLELDFSSLLGPLFFEWLMQLLLPVFVFTLVHEKEHSLRIMMKMQGLPDRVYYLVTYMWQMSVYIVFMAVFAIFGSAIGLKMFTKNSWGVQIMLYFLWGNVLCAGSLSFSAICRQARPAVLVAVIWVIMSGFGANLVLTQFIEQGPSIAATILQIIPSMGLFRGLYELSQYAFLADRNGGTGLTWAKLHDPGCGMITVWGIFAAEWVLFMTNAWYLDQVLDTGIGTPKHPMFLLGRTYKDADSKPDQATVQRPHARAMRTWWLARKGPASNSDNAAPREVSNSSRVLHNSELPNVSAMHDQHKQPSQLPEHAASGESSASSLPSSSTSFSSTSSVPETNVPFQQSASMPSHENASQIAVQRDSQLPSDNSQIFTASSTGPMKSRHTGFAPLAQNAAVNKRQVRPQNIIPGPQRHTNTAPSQALAASAIDLEAQNSLPMQQTHADAAQDAAASTRSDSESDWAGDEPSDVAAERARVGALWNNRQSPSEGDVTGSSSQPAILLHNLRKVYKGKDGNGPKIAVAGLSLAINRQECFGLLGPNGAGKTTTIRMMEGFMDASSGSIVIEGHSVRSGMEGMSGLVGICPQHDLLWESLTGREHLLFYARLHALKGRKLSDAVTEGLRSVNLLADKAGDKLVSSYSGGMKRRLSVAVALIGRPKVVYLDEPSTGLDPSSRRLLWDVIRSAKQTAAVVLTTHSMEEAEALCDRIGIFVGGRLSCIDNPQELTARYGDYLSFSLSVPPKQAEAACEAIAMYVHGAHLIHSLGGTLKMELPSASVDVGQLFEYMDKLKRGGTLQVRDWGVSHATLEEVFIRITRDAGVRLTAFT